MNTATREGILSVQPADPGEKVAAGLRPLGLDTPRDGILYLPPRPDSAPHPLMVLLHGAGGDSSNVLSILESTAVQNGCALLVPDARQYTWDVLIGGFGPDVEFLDRALGLTFTRCMVDTSRIAIAGFSDGASYALTLGLTNGSLFSHVMAFSPGLLVPSRLDGSPRIFISHGERDEVLPIDRCSRRIVPNLQKAQFDVSYREFPDGHIVPDATVTEATAWFLRSADEKGLSPNT